MHQLSKKVLVAAVCLVIITLALLVTSSGLTTTFQTGNFSTPEISESDALRQEIENIYNARNNAFVTGDTEALKSWFDTTQKYGQWSYEHEVRRVKYLNDWAQKRGMKFTRVESQVRLKKVYSNSETNAKAFLEESYRFDYIYPEDEESVTNSFGVGIRHTLKLIKRDDRWVVYNDWYTDCFEDALQSYTASAEREFQPAIDMVINTIGALSMNSRKYYNREKAAEYADKYCGAAWGSGNDYKYNKKYMDFNGIGGDCTNYVSQVLGDSEGGGLKMDGAWFAHYSNYGRAQGSRAWVNADGLKQYLVYSGKGSVIRKGTFKELTAPIDGYPGGAVEKLKLADLVCYEKKGNIDHFAVITGWDSHGYPLVNSHTTDRYHVPWDLGWGDKHIKFFLIHING